MIQFIWRHVRLLQFIVGVSNAYSLVDSIYEHQYVLAGLSLLMIYLTAQWRTSNDAENEQ